MRACASEYELLMTAKVRFRKKKAPMKTRETKKKKTIGVYAF